MSTCNDGLLDTIIIQLVAVARSRTMGFKLLDAAVGAERSKDREPNPL
jgi:hypothetical protein